MRRPVLMINSRLSFVSKHTIINIIVFLYFSSGLLNEFIKSYDFINLTVIFNLLIILSLLKYTKCNYKFNKILFYFLIIMHISLLFGLAFNELHILVVKKYFMILMLNIIPAILIFNYYKDHNEKGIFKLIFALTMIELLSFVITGGTYTVNENGYEHYSVSGFGEDYIYFARNMILAVFILVLFKDRLNSMFYVLCFMILIYHTFIAESKGALLALVLTGIFYIFKYKSYFYKVSTIVVIFISLFFIVTILDGTEYMDLVNFIIHIDQVNFTNLESQNTIVKRLYMYVVSINLSLDNYLLPLGYDGINIFTEGSKYHLGHPHNIIMEFLIDGGIISVFIFLVILYKIYKKFDNNTEDKFYFLIITFLIISYMFSSGIVEMRNLFIIIALFLSQKVRNAVTIQD
jgi:hypothetical protein